MGMVAGNAERWLAGCRQLVLRHKFPAGVLASLLLVVFLATGYYLASPLWIRTTLVEPAAPSQPGAVGPAQGSQQQAQNVAAGARGTSGDTSGSVVIRRGDFVSADAFHFGRGHALINEVAPGRYTLRVEDFSVINGPDLFMYLSPNPAGYAPDAINLGRLKATDGSFSYDIPEATDISTVRSVIVWCRQFGVLFASATLA